MLSISGLIRSASSEGRRAARNVLETREVLQARGSRAPCAPLQALVQGLLSGRGGEGDVQAAGGRACPVMAVSLRKDWVCKVWDLGVQ